MGVSRQYRDSRFVRMNELSQLEAERKRQEDKKRRIQEGLIPMREVVEYFYNNCPFELTEEDRETIETMLFNGKGTKSKLGVINVLAARAGYRWPEWTQMAKQHFGIDY